MSGKDSSRSKFLHGGASWPIGHVFFGHVGL
jgi:hypothetical protein